MAGREFKTVRAVLWEETVYVTSDKSVCPTTENTLTGEVQNDRGGRARAEAGGDGGGDHGDS